MSAVDDAGDWGQETGVRSQYCSLRDFWSCIQRDDVAALASSVAARPRRPRNQF